MLHSKFKVSDVQQWCVETLHYNGHHKLAEEMKEWVMPRLPVTGNDLKEHVTQSMCSTVVFIIIYKAAHILLSYLSLFFFFS